MERRLYRSKDERIIFGVCGGVADYLDWDPTLVRVLFILGAVFSSGGVVLAYLVLAIIMPQPERVGPITGEAIRENLDDLEQRARELGEDIKYTFQERPRTEGEEAHPKPGRRADAWIIGPVLIVAGVIFLLDNLRLFAWWRFGQLWPLILVVIGIALVLRRKERQV